MLKTWTDTHYNLAASDWLYIAKHEQEKSVSLVCPGYAREGQGFSIHFSSAQISVLEQLLQALREIESLSPQDCNTDPVSQTYSGVIPLWDEMPKLSLRDASQTVPVLANPKLITYPVGREK